MHGMDAKIVSGKDRKQFSHPFHAKYDCESGLCVVVYGRSRCQGTSLPAYNFLQLFMCLSTFCLLEKCLLQPSHTSALLSSPSSCSVDDDNLLQIFMCRSTFCLFTKSFLQLYTCLCCPFLLHVHF